MTTTVTRNSVAGRYELHDADELAAIVEFRVDGPVVDLVHTETLPGFEGRGRASVLVAGVLDDIRSRGEQVRPSCPYVRSYLLKHPTELDLVPEEIRVALLDDERPE